jgi:O-antigen/teichoic acid export membrane protein
MVTSLIGALSNIGLNLWLIPSMGPMGAAIATLVSYLIVFVIRALHTRRFIRYRVSPLWLGLNAVLLGGLCTIVTLVVSGWVWYAIALCLGLALINAPYLVRSLWQLLSDRRKKV